MIHHEYVDTKNKTAIVTRAGFGIGWGIDVSSAEAGANVVVADISDKGGMETLEVIKAEWGKATFIKVT